METKSQPNPCKIKEILDDLDFAVHRPFRFDHIKYSLFGNGDDTIDDLFYANDILKCIDTLTNELRTLHHKSIIATIEPCLDAMHTFVMKERLSDCIPIMDEIHKICKDYSEQIKAHRS